MDRNDAVTVTVTVVREDGSVLGTVIVRERVSLAEGPALDDYEARLRRWIEERPSPSAEVTLYPARRTTEPGELDRMLDWLVEPEQRVYDWQR